MRGRLPWPFPLGVRFLLWSCAALPADLSPLELHGRFLDLVIQGESTRPLALRWSRQSGDRSFDTFLEDSPPIREAMNLEQKALLSWDQGKHDEAVDLYRRAGGLLLLEKAFSEAAFCYYFIGELLAEEENIELSSQYLRAALSLAGTRSRPFLTGLIFQGLANNLWFSGHLDLSVWAFGEAESCWERIQFSHGHIAILHNLALLYRELGFQSTAQRYYERALERLEDTAEMPEISFQILAGFTKFLVGSGDREGALATLEKARRQPGEDPFELLLLEYAVNPGEATREALAGGRCTLSPGRHPSQSGAGQRGFWRSGRPGTPGRGPATGFTNTEPLPAPPGGNRIRQVAGAKPAQQAGGGFIPPGACRCRGVNRRSAFSVLENG